MGSYGHVSKLIREPNTIRLENRYSKIQREKQEHHQERHVSQALYFLVRFPGCINPETRRFFQLKSVMSHDVEKIFGGSVDIQLSISTQFMLSQT